MIVDNPDRFIKISMGNTGLPYMPNTPKDVIDKVHEFRKSKIKLTPLSMIKEVSKMDSGLLDHCFRLISGSFHPLTDDYYINTPPGVIGNIPILIYFMIMFYLSLRKGSA